MSLSSPRLGGLRIVSLALNLPGPAALMQCRQMGARCLKLEPPAGDPMRIYSPQAYDQLHEGVTVQVANLKTPEGQAALHAELAHADVLITSFRPSALRRLGLDWATLHARHPRLSQVAIVGASGARAEEPGHDLTYQAEHDLVTGLNLPASLHADMGGALAAMQAVLQAALLRAQGQEGDFFEVGLADAAGFLALPRRWGLTTPAGAVGGAHAGYRVYACRDGRVAVAALEPHFAAALCAAAGHATGASGDVQALMQAPAHDALAAFFGQHTRSQLEQLASTHDLPLHTLPP